MKNSKNLDRNGKEKKEVRTKTTFGDVKSHTSRREDQTLTGVKMDSRKTKG